MTFTTYQVTKGINSCSNTDKLSIFHLKHLGSRGIDYHAALFNDFVTSCRIPSIWKSSIGIPIPKPGKDSSVQRRKLWRLFYFQPSTATCFHPQTNTVYDPDTSALLQLTSDIATGFNHNVMLSTYSTLPEATDLSMAVKLLKWQTIVTSCRCVKSKARIVHTGVPQGSKMSPTLFISAPTLLISTPKLTATLFTPDPKQANTQKKIKISDA